MTDAQDLPDVPDPLDPLDVVAVGPVTIVPDTSRPVAAVVEGDEFQRWLTWPTAPLPSGAVDGADVWPSPSGVWIVYAAEDMEQSSRTAVFLSPEQPPRSVELGDRRPIGVDAEGLWVGDPRDASFWTEESSGTAEDHDDLSRIDPETLEWAPVAPFWPDRDTWTEPEDDEDEEENEDEDRPDPLDGDGDGDDDDDETFVGTASQWTVSIGRQPGSDDDQDDDDADDGPVSAPLPTPPTEIVRITPADERTTVLVDHLVDAVSIEDGRMTLRFHPAGPRQVEVPFGERGPWRSWDTVYEPREVVVDVTAGLPSAVVTEDHASVPATDEDGGGDLEELEAVWAAEDAALQARRAPWVGRLDLTGASGASWQTPEPDPETVERSVAAVREQFVGLSEPSVMWSADTDTVTRVRSDYRAVQVDVDGAWPDTEVVVSFEHTAVPFLRLRRRYRVFDDAGYPIDRQYVTVHLEEDVATGHIPSRGAAVDGVLDI
ncbi:hypothetical protein [Curtobacterium herbarum]|uniref:Uncharacterized protein n=1 Tax=Curtobacterium herbarum TaxID=150122 RepID=A0ABN1ZG74_9MICO|nr:hypothetical protein [Curtobacterium herbarum]MBM7474461.1 hypothetical protein [Curtobacterium herbarum]MCS6545846.1 hypothetical protein [Curtobacterium herbarum]